MKAAFTLLELLVVVAILGVLAAFLFPAASRSLHASHMTQSMSNLRQLVIANQAYAADHGRFCPADDRFNSMRWCAKRVGSKWDRTQGYLSGYLGESRSVGICPLFEATSDNSFEEGTGGYGYNASYIGGTPAWSYDGSTHARVSAMLSQIQHAKTVMFTTAGYANGDNIQEYPYCEPPFWDFGDGPTEWRPSPTVHFRYQGKALVAWADGSATAETCDPREVGYNPHGGDANAQKLGWFGPDEENGYWNPARSYTHLP